jgi:hypothetical protein
MSQEYLTKKGMKAAKGLQLAKNKQTATHCPSIIHVLKSENANHTF